MNKKFHEVVLEDDVEEIDIDIEFDGERGVDGVSPTIEVSREGAVTKIEITDAKGVKNAEINDGVSPVVTVEDIEGGKRISVTDAEGTKSADIMDGHTPIKGVDYTDGKDGYTPQKYIDYFDGTSVEIRRIISSSESGGENIVEFSDGKQLAVRNGETGYTPQKNVDYFDGEPITVETVTESEEDGGENIVMFSDGKSVTVRNGHTGGRGEQGEAGISAKHSWNGTVLTIESASGVSSADLRGERGLQGEPGKDGTGVTILGSYATEAELIAAHPTGNAGDAYMIDGNLYVWSATTNAWENVGNIKGDSGFSPTVAVSKSGKVTTVTITDKDGAKTATINDGVDGANGKDGESIGIEDYGYGLDNTTVAFTDGSVIQIPNGVGIKNIRLSKESETGNTYKIELTNGQNYDFVAPAGPTGKTGADGSKGKSAYEVACDNGFVGDEEDWLETLVGPKGNNGAHGTHAEHWWEGTVLTVRSASGESSADLKGEKGDTPVAGVDFFTEAEKTEMMAPATALATEAKSTADSAKTMAREASENASEALDLADDANDTATAAMEAVGNLKTETWTFTLEDGSTVTKAVYVG